jgi:hypothetical protein
MEGLQMPFIHRETPPGTRGAKRRGTYPSRRLPPRQLAMVSYLRLLRPLWRSFVQVSLQLPRLSFSLLPVVRLQQRAHTCLSEKKTPFVIAFVCLSNTLSLCVCGTALSPLLFNFLLCSACSHLSHVNFSRRLFLSTGGRLQIRLS